MHYTSQLCAKGNIHRNGQCIRYVNDAASLVVLHVFRTSVCSLFLHMPVYLTPFDFPQLPRHLQPSTVGLYDCLSVRLSRCG